MSTFILLGDRNRLHTRNHTIAEGCSAIDSLPGSSNYIAPQVATLWSTNDIKLRTSFMVRNREKTK